MNVSKIICTSYTIDLDKDQWRRKEKGHLKTLLLNSGVLHETRFNPCNPTMGSKQTQTCRQWYFILIYHHNRSQSRPCALLRYRMPSLKQLFSKTSKSRISICINTLVINIIFYLVFKRRFYSSKFRWLVL